MSSTNVSRFCRDVEPLLVLAHNPELSRSAKTAIVDRIGAIHKFSAQQAAAAIVRRVWPGRPSHDPRRVRGDEREHARDTTTANRKTLAFSTQLEF